MSASGRIFVEFDFEVCICKFTGIYRGGKTERALTETESYVIQQPVLLYTLTKSLSICALTNTENIVFESHFLILLNLTLANS
jgi:hypothetical protein